MQLPLSAVRSSDVTDSLLQHVVEVNGISYIQVHPTFLYESLWNLILLILLILSTKHKRFDGEVFLLYLAGYGIGRFWIESLRTDQLLLPVIGYPVSMALAALLVIVSVSWIIIWHIRRHKKQHKIHLDGKILHTWKRVEDFFGKNTAIVYPFSRKTGKTLDFRVVLGYYGYIVVESGVKIHFVVQSGEQTEVQKMRKGR